MLELVNEIEQLLAHESEGVSCVELARRLHRRKADVLDALESDSRFLRAGPTRGPLAKWALTAEGRREHSWEQLEAPASANPGIDVAAAADRLETLPASRCVEPSHANRIHYRTDDGHTVCAACDPAPQPPIISHREWIAGHGSEVQQQRFESDWFAVVRGTATLEQRERFTLAVKGSA
jgi:hypothetical protein